jgi:hypothetical protein
MNENTINRHEKNIQNILYNIACFQAHLNLNLFNIIENEFVESIQNVRLKRINQEFILNELQNQVSNNPKLLMPTADEYDRLKMVNFRKKFYPTKGLKQVIPFIRKV